MAIQLTASGTNTIKLTLELPEDASNGVSINTATVTYKIFDSSNTEIDNGVLAHVTGSDGVYIGNTNATLIAGRAYRVTVTVVEGIFNRTFFEEGVARK